MKHLSRKFIWFIFSAGIILGALSGLYFYKKSHPAISVVMAVYNSEEYLDDNITSVLNQTFEDFEFIIVNDASTDNSQQIIDKYAASDKRIRTFQNAKNSGAAATRNEGLKHIRGKYTLVIDSDDALMPNTLKTSYLFAEHDNLDIFIFCPIAFNEQTKEFEHFPVLNRKYIQNNGLKIFKYTDYYDRAFQLTLYHAWNKFIRTDIIKKNNLHFLPHKYYDDAYFAFMATLYAKRISFTWEQLYIYRINRKGSQSDKFSDTAKMFGKLELAKLLFQEMQKRNFPIVAFHRMIQWLKEENHPLAEPEAITATNNFIADIQHYISLRAESAN